jgi:hypothetical protein
MKKVIWVLAAVGLMSASSAMADSACVEAAWKKELKLYPEAQTACEGVDDACFANSYRSKSFAGAVADCKVKTPPAYDFLPISACAREAKKEWPSFSVDEANYACRNVYSDACFKVAFVNKSFDGAVEACKGVVINSIKCFYDHLETENLDGAIYNCGTRKPVE